MANSKQALKRARQAVARRARNMSLRSAMRTSVKKVRAAVVGADKAAAPTALVAAHSMLDKMAGGGVIHPNKAARLKSRLAKAVKALAA
jgi:small subunit ribosomal protein S20